MTASRCVGVGMERVRVEAEAGDGQALRLDLGADVPRLARRQVRDVDVARAGVAAGRAGRLRPAGDLEDLEAARGGPVGDLHERRLRERRGQEPELHRAASVVTGCGGSGPRCDRRRPSVPRGRCGRWPRRRASRRGRRRTWGSRGGRRAPRPPRPRRRRGSVHRRCRRSPRRGRPAGRDAAWPAGAHQGGVADEDLVRPLAVAEPGLVGLLGVPRPGAVAAVDLVDERVLPTGADLGDADRAAGAAVEAEQDRGRVLGRDVARDGLGRPLGRERLDRPGRLVARLDEGGQVGHHLRRRAGRSRRSSGPASASRCRRPRGARRRAPAAGASSSRCRAAASPGSSGR